MPDLLKLSRAARLAGVSRSDLQDKIRSGVLETFEGKVKITDLVRVYPQVDLDRDPMLEKMQRIKDNARAKGALETRETGLPSAEILLQRLHSLAGMLIDTKSRLDYQTELLTTLSGKLGELSQMKLSSEELHAKIEGLDRWLRDVLAERHEKPEDSAVLFARNLLLHVIAASVKLIPSGHEFFVEGGDTILQAAVRKGLHVGYGCNDGSCGACKARLISGEVIETQKPLYRLSPHEQQMGYLLMCCNSAVTDLTLEAALAASPAELPMQELSCQVEQLQRLPCGSQLLQLQVPQAQNFQFFAGQSAELELPRGGAVGLPVISCPCDGARLQFVAPEQQEEGAVSAAFGALAVGDAVKVRGPFGDFVLDVETETPTLFIACDEGFSAVKSMIEHGISIDRIPAFYLYRFASPGRAFYLENICRAWADSLDNFVYRAKPWLGEASDTLSSPPWAADFGAADFADLSEATAYLAGPGLFVDQVAHALIDLGLNQDQLHLSRLAN